MQASSGEGAGLRERAMESGSWRTQPMGVCGHQRNLAFPKGQRKSPELTLISLSAEGGSCPVKCPQQEHEGPGAWKQLVSPEVNGGDMSSPFLGGTRQLTLTPEAACTRLC